MPALDYCQNQIIRALQKAGWTVSAKPQRLIVGRRVVYIDLIAMQDSHKVFIEVKCFVDFDSTHEQYAAIGQYLIYRTMLQALGDSTPLYLTIPSKINDGKLDRIMRSVIDNNRIKLLTVDIAMESVRQWIE
jgi:XisH protein